MNLRPAKTISVWAAIVAAAALACGGGIIFGAALTGYRTYFTRGQYCPPGSLGEHLFNELQRLTNTPNGSPDLTATRTSTTATWNTNGFFWGCSNLTGMSHLNTNDGNQFLFRKTALTPIHIITAGHLVDDNGTNNFAGQPILFVDRTNGQHWHTIQGSRSRVSAAGDYTLIVLAVPLPASIEPLPFVWPTTISNRLANRLAEPWPLVKTCQHSRVYNELGITYGSAHGVAGGDSGSPVFIVVSNRCLFTPIGFGAALVFSETQFMTDLNDLTVQAGYATNTYQPVIETLAQFPTL